ncbi:MAG: TyeA family type III secretion system gatekeeper subunit [Puniceicoccales bacterium]|nr:TyeA family type III secretion system gatekeeper subunit [Puniceicoccales bacterium]
MTVVLSEERQLAITRNILRIVQSGSVATSQIEGVLQDFALPEKNFEERIFMLSRLAELTRELSMKAFRSAEQRLEILDAIQEVLDHYIEMEDVIFDEIP